MTETSSSESPAKRAKPDEDQNGKQSSSSREDTRVSGLTSLRDGFIPEFKLLNVKEDEVLAQYHSTLCPTSEHATGLSELVNAIMPILAAQTEDVFETHLVGPFAKGILLRGQVTAEVVIICKEPPELGEGHNISQFANTIKTGLNQKFPEKSFSIDFVGTHIVIVKDEFKVVLRNTWFGAWKALAIVKDKMGIKDDHKIKGDIEGTSAFPKSDDPTPEQLALYSPPTDTVERLKAVSTTLPLGMPVHNLTFYQLQECEDALMLIRQAMWFKDIGNMDTVCKSVIQIVKNFKRNREAWNYLSDWAVEVIVDRAIPHHKITPFGLSWALRKVFEFFSGGFALPGSVGIPDPCVNRLDMQFLPNDELRSKEWFTKEIAAVLDDERRKAVTRESQKILSEISRGDWNTITSTVI